MIIYLQEFLLQIFLWILRALDGITELFSSLTGITKISYRGQEINLIEFLVGDSTVSKVFWCVFILAIGLSCMFAIIALIKNMLSNTRNVSNIIGKFFLSLLGTMAMLVVVILGILISNSLLVLIADIFQIDTSVSLSARIFDLCVGDWLNEYSVVEIDFNTVTVKQIFGEYDESSMFGVFPTAWKMNGMINPETFLYFPAFLVVFGLGFALIKAIIRLVKRVYELLFMYTTMPMFLSTLPLDDGARFRSWRESFLTKVVLTYGTVFSVSIFALLLPMISDMHIEGISEMGNTLFKVFMMIGGGATIPAGQALFSKLFGSGELTDKHQSISVREVQGLIRANFNMQSFTQTKQIESNKYTGETVGFSMEESGGAL